MPLRPARSLLQPRFWTKITTQIFHTALSSPWMFRGRVNCLQLEAAFLGLRLMVCVPIWRCLHIRLLIDSTEGLCAATKGHCWYNNLNAICNRVAKLACLAEFVLIRDWVSTVINHVGSASPFGASSANGFPQAICTAHRTMRHYEHLEFKINQGQHFSSLGLASFGRWHIRSNSPRAASVTLDPDLVEFGETLFSDNVRRRRLHQIRNVVFRIPFVCVDLRGRLLALEHALMVRNRALPSESPLRLPADVPHTFAMALIVVGNVQSRLVVAVSFPLLITRKRGVCAQGPKFMPPRWPSTLELRIPPFCCTYCLGW